MTPASHRDGFQNSLNSSHGAPCERGTWLPNGQKPGTLFTEQNVPTACGLRGHEHRADPEGDRRSEPTRSDASNVWLVASSASALVIRPPSCPDTQSSPEPMSPFWHPASHPKSREARSCFVLHRTQSLGHEFGEAARLHAAWALLPAPLSP